MSFLTQVRQVLQRDTQNARWALIAFVATLGYAVAQGRQLLEPLPIIDNSFSVPADWSTATVVVAPLVTFLLAGLVALAFAPLVGAGSRPNQAWRSLPITPNAVWVARMLWVLGSFVLTMAVVWLVLRPLPIAGDTRLSIVTSVAMNTAAIMLAGTVLASVAASVRTFLGWMLLTPLLVFIIPLLDLFGVGPGVAWTLLTVTTTLVVGLALVTAAVLLALLRARRVGWLARGGAGAMALCLLWANIVREPAPSHADVQASLPTLVAVSTPRASLERVSGTIMIATMSDDPAGATADLPRANSALRSSASTSVDAPIYFTLRLEPQLVSRSAQDRIVLRPRAATVRTADGTWRFHVASTDAVVSPGDLPLGTDVRWLNAPQPGVQTASATATRRPSDVPVLDQSTASFTIELARQQPVVLAQIPLDGSPSSGPWRQFMRAQLTAPADSEHTVRVSLARLSGTHARSASHEVVTTTVTYALLHPVRGEAMHLVTRRHFTSSVRGWALAPSLLDAVHAGLYPAGTTAATMRDVADAEWLRGSSLVVIGWRTVERGAMALEAPLAAPVAMR